MLHAPPRSPLFPYTTLFRSNLICKVVVQLDPNAVRLKLAGDCTTKPEDIQTISTGHSIVIPCWHEVPKRLHGRAHPKRSEEHTSELQSRGHLVCRLLLEKQR